MYLTSSLIGTAMAAALLATTPPGPSQARADTHFPAPSGAITIAATTADGGPSMADVLRDFARVAGQNLSISTASRAALEATPAGLIASAEVPAAEVYSFVEGLLAERGFVMSELRDQEPRLLGIYNQQEGLSAPAQWVPADQLERFRAHPALVVLSVLCLEELDVRQLGNSLRALGGLGSGVVPIGSTNSVLLMGTGRNVADLAQVMLAANEAAGASRQAREPLEIEAVDERESAPKKSESEKQDRER
jgi:hypothetical protein